jgi:photosystem II stability/assembly factor-like uncharacterized protein
MLPILVLLCAVAACAQSLRQEVYAWKNVQIVGGGFVDGIVFHPSAEGIRYARTDMGGAYRWDEGLHRWQPILDWVSHQDLNLMGIESIAVDPANPGRVYLACGTYTNAAAPDGALLRSQDGGRTFQRSNLPFKLGGNEDGRGNGERLAVDPRDNRILYLGTRHDGLWRSRDSGATWARVDSFPDVTEAVPPDPKPIPGETPEQRWRRMPVRGSGVVFVQFDPKDGSETHGVPSKTIYAGVSLMNRPNLFASSDGGESWHAIPGEPTAYRPTRAALSLDGFLYVAYGSAPGPSTMTNGAVWKLDTHTGAWTDITPERPVASSREFGYAAVSVDAHNPQTLIASSFDRPEGEEIFRSKDGGATWKPIFGAGKGVFNYSLAPYVASTPIHWLFDIEIDPTNPDHAVFTTGYGGWETFDLTAADRGDSTHWQILASGIEETVALGLDSPARGAHLITAIGDYGGFVHWDLDRPASAGSSAPPRMGNTTDVASAALHPEVLVRVGIDARHKLGGDIAYSRDSGSTWSGTAGAPSAKSRGGSIAVSADGQTWVWTPENEGSSFTGDEGKTWTQTRGLPAGLRVVADPVDPRSFYAMSLADSTLYSSKDGAAIFTARPFTMMDDPPFVAGAARGDSRGGQDRIYTTPGRSGDLWLAAFDGLYRTDPSYSPAASGGVSFVRLPDVDEIEAFGFGKNAPHESYPALYLAGKVHGQSGVFRSIDQARTWVRINDDQHQWGLILQIAGDPRQYGRVYVGTHGRGVVYGDPAGN